MFSSKVVSLQWKALVVALGLSSGALASEIQISSPTLLDFEFGVVESKPHSNLYEKARQMYNDSYMPTASEASTENVWDAGYVHYIYPNYEGTGYRMVMISGNTGIFAALAYPTNGQELSRQQWIDGFKVEYNAGRRQGIPDLRRDTSAQAYVGHQIGRDGFGNTYRILRSLRLYHSGFGERQVIIKNTCNERSGCRINTDANTTYTIPYGEATNYEVGYKEFH